MKVSVYDKHRGHLVTGVEYSSLMLAAKQVKDPQLPDLERAKNILAQVDRFETQDFCIIRE